MLERLLLSESLVLQWHVAFTVVPVLTIENTFYRETCPAMARGTWLLQLCLYNCKCTTRFVPVLTVRNTVYREHILYKTILYIPVLQCHAAVNVQHFVAGAEPVSCVCVCVCVCVCERERERERESMLVS
jgi:hypothetical protein